MSRTLLLPTLRQRQRKPIQADRINWSAQGVPTDGLRGAWFMTSSPDGVLRNLVSGAPSGVPVGTPTQAAMEGGVALRLNGSSQYVPLEDFDLDYVTMVARCREGSGGSNVLFCKDYNGANVPYALATLNTGASNGMSFYNGSWQSSNVVSGATPTQNDGRDHTIGGTFDGTNLMYWVDGELNSSNTIGATVLPKNDNPLDLGVYRTNNHYFDGTIEWALLYDRALSAGEMMALHTDAYRLLDVSRRRIFAVSAPAGGSTPANKDANVRTRIAAGAFKDAGVRARIAVQAFKDVGVRFRLGNTAFKDAASRFSLRVGAYKDAGVRFVLALGNQIARPTADVSNDNWTNELGATTGLYASIDETTASDTDYIQSSPSPMTWEEYKTRLGDLVDPGVTTGHTIRVQFKKDTTGGDRIDLMVSLYRADGTTLITQQGYANIDALTTVDIDLSEPNADDIPYADYPDLVIGLAAINNTGGGGVPPWL